MESPDPQNIHLNENTNLEFLTIKGRIFPRIKNSPQAYELTLPTSNNLKIITKPNTPETLPDLKVLLSGVDNEERLARQSEVLKM
jgi:hypothetical protein